MFFWLELGPAKAGPFFIRNPHNPFDIRLIIFLFLELSKIIS